MADDSVDGLMRLTVDHDILAAYGNPVAVHPLDCDDRDAWLREPQLLLYPNGDARFAHTCTRPRDGLVVRCAPLLDPGHSVYGDVAGPPTVSPSVLCDDCGMHGWITAGVWRNA